MESSDDDAEWLFRFRRLNERHEKQLLFRLGSQAGFFSEVNNMLLAVLYCLKSNIRFALSSKGGTVAVRNGWTDYFVPIFEERGGPFERRLNMRPDQVRTGALRIGAALYRRLTGVDYLTQDLWAEVRNRRMEAYRFDVPELGIRGGLLQATETLIRRVWRFNDRTGAKIAAWSSRLGLPAEYIGLHVRRGDKGREASEVGLDRYVERLMQVTGVRNVFLVTDDFSVVREFERQFKQYTVFTLCNPEQRGYWQAEFLAKPAEQRYAAIVHLLADIEILRRSTAFVGTFSSNVGMFISMSRAGRECYGTDFDHWRIW
jgi:hypothetical protein